MKVKVKVKVWKEYLSSLLKVGDPNLMKEKCLP